MQRSGSQLFKSSVCLLCLTFNFHILTRHILANVSEQGKRIYTHIHIDTS